MFALILFAAVLRWHGIGFGLPHWVEPDASIVDQVETLRGERTESDVGRSFADYPLLLARIVQWTSTRPTPLDVEHSTLEQHLERASVPYVEVRRTIAFLSLGIVPATWWLARRFVSRGWACFAAALVATSVLDLQFAQQARPHAAAATFTAFALVAALRMRERGTWGSYALAGIAAALAIASLQSGVSVLFALAAAHWFRDFASWRARFREPRIVAALGPILVAIPIFYPFWFEPTDAVVHAKVEIAQGKVRTGSHTLSLSSFDGRGFPIVARTLWFYEPVLAVLLALGVFVVLARIVSKGSITDRHWPRAIAVVLGWSLAYFIVLGIFHGTAERFVLPLIPVAALAATAALAWSCERLRVPRLAAIGVAVLALALPTFASIELARLRSRPDTLTEAAQWLLDNLHRSAEPIYLNNAVELPVARTAKTLRDREHPEQFVELPWKRYQLGLDASSAPPPRFPIEPLIAPHQLTEPVERFDAAEFVRALGRGWVVMAMTLDMRSTDVALTLRSELARRAELVFTASPDPESHECDPPFTYQDDSEEEPPNFTARLLRARALGPKIEIRKLP